jgi:hypothetical protein
MRTICWKLDVGLAGVDISDEFEVEANATEAEIEEQVREEIWNRVSFFWEEKPSG